MEIIRENPLKWHYKIGGKYYNITIDDELEHWLKKDRFQPEINEKGIVKLKGVLIEKILEYLMEDNKSNYDFKAKDTETFKRATDTLSK